MRGLAIVGAAALIAQSAATVAPGVRLNYTDSGGTGAAIVLMHAATGSVRSWEHQTASFVKNGYRVIAMRDLLRYYEWSHLPDDPMARERVSSARKK